VEGGKPPSADSPPSSSSRRPLDDFSTWLEGKWEPKVYTNIKPTPIGTAYPIKARVDRVKVLWLESEGIIENHDGPARPAVTAKSSASNRNNAIGNAKSMRERFAAFTMVRDDDEAEALARERSDVQSRVAGLDVWVAWPAPPAPT